MHDNFGKLKGKYDWLERLLDDWIFPLGFFAAIGGLIWLVVDMVSKMSTK